MAERVAQLAGFLEERGIGPGARVLLHVSPGRKEVTDLLGILAAGAAAVVVDPREPPQRVRRVFRLASPAAVITDAARADRFDREGDDADVLLLVHSPPGLSPSLPDAVLFETVNARSGEPRPFPVVPEHGERLLLVESGEDGPYLRAVRESEGSARRGAWSAIAPAAEEDRSLVLPNAASSHPLLEVLEVLAVGGRVIRGAGLRSPELLREHGVTRLVAEADVLLPVLAQAPAFRAQLWLLCGGARVPVPLDARPGAPRNAHWLYEGGGTGTHPASRGGSGELRLAPGTTLRIVDPRSGRDAQEGVLVVQGPGVSGTVLGPEAVRTTAPFQDLVSTGELAGKREEGIVLTGRRTDRRRRRGGFLAAPGELEGAARRHAEVRSARVEVRPTPSGEPRWALVVRAPSLASATELRRFLATELPPWLLPEEIEVLGRPSAVDPEGPQGQDGGHE